MHPDKQNVLPSRSTRYKVLLVDDDASVLKSTAAALEFELDVVTCNSAERALARLAAGDVHVVCSDYTMAGMTGLELLNRVAELPQAVSGLLMTGSDSFLGRPRGVVGEHYVLVKPVDPKRLASLIVQLARIAVMKRGTRLDNSPQR